MGHMLCKITEPIKYTSGNLNSMLTRRKRKRSEEDSSDDITSALEKSLQVPKKKKLISTTQYIYQTLFKEQKNSDITVMALGKTWHLHKIYLCQSPYFFSMFNGSWKESCQNFVHIKILDPKITIESLDAVFGSLYSDEVIIEPLCVVSMLATATLFQLENLIEKCTEVMIETINAETAIPYYKASCQYGVQNVKKATFNWLLVNLLSFYYKHIKWLRLINCDLMKELVSHPDLYVMQTEFSLYVLLRSWLYLKLNPDYEPNNSCKTGKNNNDNNKNVNQENANVDSQNNDTVTTNSFCPRQYFIKRKDTTPYLLTKDGLRFQETFKSLRIQHLLNHHVDLKLLLEDNIIPQSWFQCHLFNNLNCILKIDQSNEIGPNEINEEIFYKYSQRCGRLISECGYHKWRWTGFNYGLDLVFVVHERQLSVKRHHRADNERLLSLRSKRQFLIRATITSLNDQRQVIRTQTTHIKLLNLEKNEEYPLLLFERDFSHPILISINLLFTLPDNNLIRLTNSESIETNEIMNANYTIPISEIDGTSIDSSNEFISVNE